MKEFSNKYDVAVLGGGVAGVAAAVQSARSGAKTVLIEKSAFLGGLATTGLIYVYLPLCDGYGHQAMFGIAEELLKISMKYGPGTVPDWRANKGGKSLERYQVCFSPASFALALDEICDDAGVDLWFDTLVSKGNIDDTGQISSVIVENKSGRGTIEADIFVDASGDADVVRRIPAGKCKSSDNYLSSWVIEYDVRIKGTEPYILGSNLGRYILQERDVKTVNEIDGRQVSHFLLESRRKIRKHYLDEYARNDVNRHQLFPLVLPGMASFRTTYAIHGKTVLNTGHEDTSFDDSVGVIADWRYPGKMWEIPYGILVPENIKGLLAAGRCISSIGDAWEATRVIPAAAVTGQIAGMAAALAVETNSQPESLDVKTLQSRLKAEGFEFHCSDILQEKD
jgi:hypothetical protein